MNLERIEHPHSEQKKVSFDKPELTSKITAILAGCRIPVHDFVPHAVGENQNMLFSTRIKNVL